ncbi:hypothetical protein [Aestuariivivens sediminis]|uniref:hypothetical protein n=1 Tax=Aestuariivivens sediminis TaxID=2913557 RepID=UPI001F56AC76|nr:hypothetical protein [Aestuariivivens sediminis]
MKKNLNSKRTLLLLLILSLFFAWSCSNDKMDSNTGKLNLSAKSTYANLATKSLNSKEMADNITIDAFLINLSKFELEVDLEDDNYHDDENEQWDDDGFYDYDDDLELMGPFELDLMSGQISFLNINVPIGNYDELEFKFDVSTDPLSDLFGKSVLIKGTVDGTPFIYWHHFDDELEVDFEDAQFDITITQNTEGIVIDFDLSQILDSVNGVDLHSAQDGNNDGTIEISPEDPDGNNDMAEAIRNKIKEYVNLFDD